MSTTAGRALVLAVFAFYLIPNLARSSPTTPGTVMLSSTFQCISVRAKYSGDSNGKNTASIQFRRPGEPGWHSAYTPIIDRRSAPDQYTTEARVSIVGLTPNTVYEVMVTWSDPDGIVGAASISNRISTLSYSPPTGGSTITVTNDSTLASALSTVVAGQTIHLDPGTYRPFIVSRGGNSGAYIVIEGDAGGGSIIAGTNINQNVYVRAVSV